MGETEVGGPQVLSHVTTSIGSPSGGLQEDHISGKKNEAPNTRNIAEAWRLASRRVREAEGLKVTLKLVTVLWETDAIINS